MSELYDGPDGCDFDSCCPNWPALKAENAELREQRMSLVRSTVILAEENTQLKALAEGTQSLNRGLIEKMAKLQAVVDAARQYRDAKHPRDTQAAYSLMCIALDALDEKCVQCGKPGPTRYGGTCSRQCEKKRGTRP